MRGQFFGELAAQRAGIEGGVSYEAFPSWHVGLLLTLGEFTGVRLVGERRWQRRWVDPLVQARFIFHPVDSEFAFGGGLAAGASKDVGPGRFLLTGVTEYYGARSGFTPYALALMGGYEVDLGKLIHRRVMVRERRVTVTSMPTLKGRFLNLDDEPVAAQLTLRRVGESRPPTVYDLSKEFELKLDPGEYEIQANAPGFLRRGRTIRASPGDVVVYDFVLRPIPSTKSAELGENEIKLNQTIQFAFNAAKILPESHFLLDEVADILLQNPELKLSVEGHTDSVGGGDFNMRLSEARAHAVAAYLADQGVHKKRMKARGFGKTKPLVNIESEEARAKNRRVEFRVYR